MCSPCSLSSSTFCCKTDQTKSKGQPRSRGAGPFCCKKNTRASKTIKKLFCWLARRSRLSNCARTACTQQLRAWQGDRIRHIQDGFMITYSRGAVNQNLRKTGKYALTFRPEGWPEWPFVHGDGFRPRQRSRPHEPQTRLWRSPRRGERADSAAPCGRAWHPSAGCW